MKKHNLLIVAHPDDETIFFGGLIQSYRRKPWHVICVTDGNADGNGSQRKRDFESACKKLKVTKSEMWNFPDHYEKRLNVQDLAERLGQIQGAEVFTHGVLGEYGHPHHQDVCVAVHRAFTKKHKVWSLAYNCFANKTIKLTRKNYQTKCEVLAKIYFSETYRFARWLPAQTTEGFASVALPEIESVYQYFLTGGPLPSGDLKAYAWFTPYLEELRSQVTARPF